MRYYKQKYEDLLRDIDLAIAGQKEGETKIVLQNIKERTTNWKPTQDQINETSYQAGIKAVLDNPDYYGLKRKPKPADWRHYDAARIESDKIMNQRAIEIVRNL